jgi:large subunit ribosomal protein L17
MRKKIFGRRLKRDINERKALFRNLMREMVIRGQIKTTEAKAKAVKPELEKTVTKALKSPTPAYFLNKTFAKNVTDRIITEIAPKFKDRPGGYTRIVKLGNRTKDDASMVLLEWVEKVEAIQTKAPKRRAANKKVSKHAPNVPKTTQKETTSKITKKALTPLSRARQIVRRVQKKG